MTNREKEYLPSSLQTHPLLPDWHWHAAGMEDKVHAPYGPLEKVLLCSDLASSSITSVHSENLKLPPSVISKPVAYRKPLLR